MSTTVAILCFINTCIISYLNVKYALNHETLIYIGDLNSQITHIFGHLKLWIALARHNFQWLKI